MLLLGLGKDQGLDKNTHMDATNTAGDVIKNICFLVVTNKKKAIW